MVPFRPVKPAGKLSARQLNAAMDGIERLAKVTADPPLEVIRAQDGIHLRDNSLRPMHVRITGGGSGANSGSGAGQNGNCYSGIQLVSDNDGSVGDLELGLEFDSTTFPLVELSGATDVPVDAIALAWPSPSGRNYEFIWDSGSSADESGSGSGDPTGCVSISDFLQCTEDGAMIRSGTLCIVNGQLVFTPT